MSQNPVQHPSISVVIPTYHAPAIERTIHALLTQQPAESLLEILVVGQQAMEKFADFPKVRYIHVAERPTPARNRNIGADQAKGEWLYFIDSDCVPQQGWLAQIIDATQLGPSVITGSVAISPETGYWGWADHLIAFDGVLADVDRRRAVAVAPSLNFGIQRSLFLAHNGFDETFLRAAGEDTDLCLRLGAAGYAIQFVPEIIVCHHHGRQDLQSTWQHLYRYGEAVTQRRQLRGKDWRWRLALRVIRIPLLCELLGVGRVLSRIGKRFVQKPVSECKNLRLYLGIAVLEYGLTLGMIHSLRREARKIHNST